MISSYLQRSPIRIRPSHRVNITYTSDCPCMPGTKRIQNKSTSKLAKTNQKKSGRTLFNWGPHLNYPTLRANSNYLLSVESSDSNLILKRIPTETLLLIAFIYLWYGMTNSEEQVLHTQQSTLQPPMCIHYHHQGSWEWKRGTWK